MHVTTVDPRDQTWEIAEPSYRVYFHDAEGASAEYEVRGGDVTDVLTWATTKCGERSYVVYVCVPVDGLGLLRLHGHDPNDATPR